MQGMFRHVQPGPDGTWDAMIVYQDEDYIWTEIIRKGLFTRERARQVVCKEIERRTRKPWRTFPTWLQGMKEKTNA